MNTPAAPAIGEQLVLLAELAALDAKGRGIAEKLESLPAPARKLDEAATALQKQVDEVTAKKELAEKTKKNIENEIQDEKLKIKKWEARAHEIRGEREHAALLSEISSAKRVIHRHEDSILEHMEVIEQTTSSLAQLSTKLGKAKDDAKAAWASVDGDLKKYKDEQAQTDVQRRAMLAKLPASVVKRYDTVAAKRQGVGVTIIKGEVCSQCKRTLPPQLCIQVRKGIVLEQCPSCSRLLVHEDMTKAPAPEAG